MKGLLSFSVVLLFSVAITTSVTVRISFGEEYLQYEVFADTNFTHPHDVCIDPGHGGPGALKFGNNGDGRGTLGCCYELSEQWVNLQVAYALRDSLYPWGNCPGQIVSGVIMTREGWTDISEPPQGWWWRVRVGNYANMGSPVHEFISIHHNGFEDTSSAPQGTESFWWNAAGTDSNFTRDTTSKLASKMRMKIRYAFNLDAECYECYTDRRTRRDSLFVLRNSRPASGLTEASDIHALTHYDEELKFMDSTFFWHAKVEAGGIYRGWCSFKNNSGLVTIRNSAITGNDGFFWTDWGAGGGEIQWYSPHYTAWEEGEEWLIVFPGYQYIGGSLVYFHHIEELEQGIYTTDQALDYVVPQCSTHTIVAYWTGGLYSVQLYSLNGGEELRTCTEKNIRWNASLGADTTTLIDIFLSRDGGGSFQPIAADLPNTGSHMWTVMGLASEECRIRVLAHDRAGNVASDTSDQNFSIQAHSTAVTFPNGGQNWSPGEQRTITWNCAYLCTTSYVDLYISRDGGGAFDPILTNALNTGSYAWTVTGPYSTHCRMRVAVDDVVGNSAEDISDYDFIIGESGNNDPVIDGHIQCKYPGEDCGDCIQYGDDVTIEIEAHDPDGDSMYYEWYSIWGHFPNGQHSMTTPQNWVVYTAPAKGGAEETVPFEDFVSVYVVDVRGGQGDTTGWVELHEQEYGCICGDANNLNGVEAGDIVFLISYLFRGGPPPADPIERGDANNNCRIDAGDPVYLMNYLFSGGPPAECCWFWPSSHEQQ